jgi:flavodoxin
LAIFAEYPIDATHGERLTSEKHHARLWSPESWHLMPVEEVMKEGSYLPRERWICSWPKSPMMFYYGMTSRNTEDLSENVADGLKSGGAEVTVKNVTDASISELRDYDAIVFGCPTYGSEELQDDFIDFNAAMSSISLKGKKAAVFGTEDSKTYPDSSCQAVYPRRHAEEVRCRDSR